MKTFGVLKSVLIFIVAFSVLSCSDDDNEVTQNLDLVGEWQRSDFSDEFEYKITFNADNTGVIIERIGPLDGSGPLTSSALEFNWRTKENTLTLNFGEEMETSNFSINSEGQLFLSELSDFYFIQLE
ncbi:hypothetical protein [Cochleicola gelatinilyticus]|uniref:Lipocalin-like domain-containing protein n=1 Tax=Cochleicola gelatinilyticus TaxID=1763537 RepID=A0A167HG68_9FLAO|nr:hypothetical protein [Cochleicola gelatinilyticus]OAB78573.1 hypothetical protein ULVI_08270 [Cochleicola gelatinilyticus]